MLGDVHAVCHAYRLLAREYRRAGIAFSLGVVPIAAVALGRKIDLTRLNLGLLQAKYVCVERGKRLCEALAEARPYSVDIPRDKPFLRHIGTSFVGTNQMRRAHIP